MDMYNSRITIRRSDGAIIDNVRSSVQRKIYLDDTKIPVEAGDIITQKLPSGIEKKMLVNDVQVYDMGSRLDHIEIEYTVI